MNLWLPRLSCISQLTYFPSIVKCRFSPPVFTTFSIELAFALADRAKVLPRVQMLRTVGIRCFQDVLDLGPGDRWERELYRLPQAAVPLGGPRFAPQPSGGGSWTSPGRSRTAKTRAGFRPSHAPGISMKFGRRRGEIRNHVGLLVERPD